MMQRYNTRNQPFGVSMSILKWLLVLLLVSAPAFGEDSCTTGEEDCEKDKAGLSCVDVCVSHGEDEESCEEECLIIVRSEGQDLHLLVSNRQCSLS